MSAATLGTEAVRVQVCATSANLGSGFDALALALGVHDDVAARVIGEGLSVSVQGVDAAELACDESHLVVRAMRCALDRLDAHPAGLEVRCRNAIPHGRGLGSSAAAIVAGLVAARGLVLDGEDRLDDAALLEIATEMEGHPDNVAACLYGGLTIAWTDAALRTDATEGASPGPDLAHPRARALRLEPHPSVVPVVLVSGEPLETSAARGLLPERVPHADAAHAAGRTALLVAAMTGRPDLLLPATEDRLHQDARAGAMPHTARLVAVLRAEGVAAVVSGAGPSVLALALPEHDRMVDAIADAAAGDWSILRPGIDLHGARCVQSAPPPQ
jgi:homoserine kinase